MCPCSGVLAGTVDLLDLAWLFRRDLEGLEEIYSLPRKFKLSLSCGREDCSSQPWINDLSFVAERQSQRVFALIILKCSRIFDCG